MRNLGLAALLVERGEKKAGGVKGQRIPIKQSFEKRGTLKKGTNLSSRTQRKPKEQENE